MPDEGLIEIKAAQTESAEIVVNREQILSLLGKIENGGLLAILFVIPFLFLPASGNLSAINFDLHKGLVLSLGTLLIATCYLLRAAISRKMAFGRSTFDLPILVLTVVSAASVLLSGTLWMSLSAFLLTTLPLALLFFLTSRILKNLRKVEEAVSWLLSSGVVLSVWTIISNLLGLTGQVPSLSAVTDFLAAHPSLQAVFNPNFSATGSLFSQSLLFLALLPLSLAMAFRRKNASKVAVAASVLLTVGLILSVAPLLANRPTLLDMPTSWKIATGSLGKSLAAALFGWGPNSFSDAFTLYKPAEINAGNLWNLRFVTSGDYYLFLLTTGGIAGLAAFIWLISRFVRTLRTQAQAGELKPFEIGLWSAAGLSLILLAVLPAPFVLLFLLFTVLGLLSAYLRTKNEDSEPVLDSPKLAPVFLVGAIVFAAGFLATSYFLGNVYLGDFNFSKSLAAAAQNKGTQTYNLQIAALRYVPWNDSYHASYSQTNLALADSLASLISNQPSDKVTSGQKNTVITLVQQSIREGRNAAALDPQNSTNWENLATIYRSLFNFAQGADQWAITAENQAIVLDPVNPRLRLDLGGIYFALGNYLAAAQSFNTAITLKPDYANAHYNLAEAAKQLKDENLARQELQAVRSLICGTANQTDCQKVEAELNALSVKAPEQPAPATPSAQAATLSAKPVQKISTASAKPILPKVKTSPAPVIATPTGELK